MALYKTTEKSGDKSQGPSFPPGRVKIAEALRLLLEKKEFGAITVAEIAKTAGITEALIYKYFEDKRHLLHQILAEDMLDFIEQVEFEQKGIKGSLNKLRKFIWSSINRYCTHHVFAKVLLLEVRNYPGYFKSETYQLSRRYSKILLDILEEGVKNGEICEDIPPPLLRRVILGSIEYLCFPRVIFNREISPDVLTEDLCKIVFVGIEKR